LKTRHLHGAFRATGLLAAVPRKEACDGEWNEDDDDSGDSIATICGLSFRMLQRSDTTVPGGC